MSNKHVRGPIFCGTGGSIKQWGVDVKEIFKYEMLSDARQERVSALFKQ